MTSFRFVSPDTPTMVAHAGVSPPFKAIRRPNAAAGVFPEPLHHAEVMETTQQVKGQFIALLEGIIGRL